MYNINNKCLCQFYNGYYILSILTIDYATLMALVFYSSFLSY